MEETGSYRSVKEELDRQGVTLVAVSKTQPAEVVRKLYDQGQRLFGENKVQELLTKKDQLPSDCRWHLIGHLQTNKVKLIAPFIDLIHSVDSLRLATEIHKQAEKNHRTIDILLQGYIASEETKFGLAPGEIIALIRSGELEKLPGIRLRGLMGMASNIADEQKVKEEFSSLHACFKQVKALPGFSGSHSFNILSMGMSGDYTLAIQEGSNMVRIGSLLFGKRN